MTHQMPLLIKAAIGSLLVSSMLVAGVAAEAQPSVPTSVRDHTQPPARDRDRDGDRHSDDDGIDAGAEIAGAIIIAGLAAILSDSSHDRDYRDGYRSQDDWRRYGGSRRAIEQCVSAAEQRASQYGDRADVTRVTRIERARRGYDVRGEIKVDRRYRRHGRDIRYRREDRLAYANYGKFRCKVRYGEVRSVRVSGLN